MNHPGGLNEITNNIISRGSSPAPNESGVLATTTNTIKYPFISNPIKTNTNFSILNGKKPAYREIKLFNIQKIFPTVSLLNSDVEATENNNDKNTISIKIPQPDQPTLILKEYNNYQNYLKTTTNANIHQCQNESNFEKESITKSKSGEVPLKQFEFSQKKKSGSKRKLIEPVRLHSSRRKFPNRPYAPYEEIIGYADGYPYDHFGSREDRKSIENENPNDKIKELMNKIQSISQQKYDIKEKEIAQKFQQVEKKPVDILIVNHDKFEDNENKVKYLPSIRINHNMFKTIILPAPIVKVTPDHVFLRRILKNELAKSKKIAQTTSKLMMCMKFLKSIQKENITKYTTFAQMATEVWPVVYKETKEDRTPEKVDVKKMIASYHQLFSAFEEYELMYYAELLHVCFNPNSLVFFSYDPKKLFV